MTTSGTRNTTSPGPKTTVTIAAVAAAASQIVIWILELVPAIGDVPFLIESAITVVLVAAITYLVPTPQ